MLSLRRRHSRWRMFPILLFLGLICSAELAPVRLPEEISSASSSSSTPKKDIDFMGDFWQALLVVDPQSGFQPSLDSRRITPKSVFIAPGVLPACAEGYHADKMGRCVKSISINATAHKDFILERLKLMFSSAQATKSDQKKSTGPLQLNIPLQLNVPAVSDIDPQPTEIEVEETFLKNQPVAAPIRNETYFAAGEEKIKLPLTMYQLKNDTTLNEEESFFFGNSNVDDIEKKLPATVPVTELVEETNDTNFSEVVDYKIPVDLKAVLNSSSVKRIDISDSTEESVSMTEKRENSNETSPALVLLISPTKLTNVVDDLSLTQNDTAEEVVQMSNFTSNTNESVTTGTPDSALPTAKQMTSIPIDEQRDNETYVKDELAPETSKPSESQETDFLYDEEDGDVDYPYSTDVPDEDDSAEGEEILKHGEAGMTIPTVRDIERPDRDRHQRQQDQIAELKKLLNTLDQIVGHLNDSAPTEDKDEAESHVSSEVSIDGDFIVETTLLDVNTERLQVTTKSPDMTEKDKDSEDDSKKLFSSESKSSHVIFPDDVHDVVTVSSHGREQLSMKFENEKNKELEDTSSSYDSPEEDSVTEIRTINDKRSKESILQTSPKDFESNVPSSSIRTTMNFDSAEEDFVRFPNYMRRPQQGGYVRFPDSGEIANSIHSLNYKQNSRYSADDVGSYGGTSTKSSVPVRQKPVYHLTASSWKSDSDHVQAAPSERQNQTPDLMHFWSKLPLIKDPAIYQNDDQEQPYSRSFRARSSRRLSPFTETSPGNRVPTQKRKTPISV